ncbi:hypothetical protein L2750_14610 [Shewanella submarina]|uniref:Plasmid replication protein, CyRepA1 family n=1 Tax=Shewanella submarina TaxID=2016376 RepID=A0ABV7G8I9_9GAMM|nr:plasmid replication protein, CyRepA1 family [Shewanella submarina]MCL1038363.1 hypothetical protein [Shewanella submarina]
MDSILKNPYIAAKKLTELDMTGVNLRVGDNSSSKTAPIRGEYIERPIFTMAFGQCGYERIYTSITHCEDAKHPKWPKRTILFNEYKETRDSSPRFTPIGHTYTDAANINSFVITGGFADGVTMWNALGKPSDICVLAIVSERQAPVLVRFIKNYKPGAKVVVALDNDTKSKTGQLCCMESETDWVVPSTHNDWNDLYLDKGLAEVTIQAGKVRAALPGFDMWKLPPLDERCKTRLIDTLAALTPDEPKAIAKVMATLIHRMKSSLFTRFSNARKLVDYLLSVNPYIAIETRRTLESRISTIEAEILKGAKDQVTIRSDIKARHKTLRFKSVGEAMPYTNSDGVFIIKAPHAGGKTSVIGVPCYQGAISRGDFVVVIAHLVTLVSDLATKFNAAHYDSIKQEAKAARHQFTRDEIAYRGLAVCLPSIAEAKTGLSNLVSRSNVVIIDEVSQVIRMCASKIDGLRNTIVFQKLVEMIRNADQVLVLDADADSSTVEFLEYCRPQEKFTIVEVPNPTPSQSGLSVEWCWGEGYRDIVYASMTKAISEDKRVMVATDGRDTAKHIHSLLEKTYPAKKFLLVTSETTKIYGSPAARFMENANVEAAKYDAIIHSPSIRSGLSITDVHFDAGFAMFTGKTILPQDAIQQLRRARMITHWVVGVAETYGEDIEDAELLQQQQRELAESEFWARGFDIDSHDIDWVKNTVDVKEAKAKNNFAPYLYLMLRHYGFNVTFADLEQIDCDISLQEYIKSQREELSAKIISTAKPSNEEAEALRGKPEPTIEERAALIVWGICEACGIDSVTEDWLSFVKAGHLTHAKRYMWATNLPYFNEGDGESAALYDFKSARADESRQLMELIGFEEGKELVMDKALAQKVIDHAWSRKERLIFLRIMSPKNLDKRYKKKTVPKPKPANPTKLATEILKGFGVILKSARTYCGKDRHRVMVTDTEKQEKITHVCNHQFSIQNSTK